MTDGERSGHDDGIERQARPGTGQWPTPPTRSRRRVLRTLAAGGSLALAGCGLPPDAGTPTQGAGGTASTATANGDEIRAVPGQTFRAPIEDNPAKTTFLPRQSLRPASLYGYDFPSYGLQRFLWETGVWPDALWVGTGEIHYTWIDDPIEITPTDVTVTIGSEAHWSDGHPITAKDIATIPLSLSLRAGFPPVYATDGSKVPSDIYTAFDDFELAERTATYRSSAGHFDTFWDIHVKQRFGTFYGPHIVPTHVEPYTSYAEAVIETVRRAQQGEVTPWERGSNTHRRALVQKHVRDKQYADKFGKATNVLATGAWDLVEMRGAQEFVFEPNEYHRNADRINFDRFVLEYTPEDTAARRTHAGLRADRFDYASALTPTSVVESLPDHIRQILDPGDIYTGNELAINFDHPGLGTRAGRAAIMYILDHEAIANNIHRSAAVPVDSPGGDCWDATEWASQSWIEENLITYEKNHEKAATLLGEAGFRRDGDRWLDPDGRPLTLTIATKADAPRWEPTVASQLGSFGIDTTVRTLSSTTFGSRTRAGDFPLWSDDTANVTNTAPNMFATWYKALVEPGKYEIFPDAQFRSGDFSPGGVPLPKTEDRWRDFTIEAPPVGRPNGPLKEYAPAVLQLGLFRKPERAFRRDVKTCMWLANWLLPVIPITKTLEQHFIDNAHWLWPADTPSWQQFTGDGYRTSGGLFASGTVQANPENPDTEG